MGKRGRNRGKQKQDRLNAEERRRREFSEPEANAAQDRRLSLLTNLTAPFEGANGVIFEAGSILKVSQMVPFRNGVSLSFGVPSMTALFLDYSLRLYAEAQIAVESPDLLLPGDIAGLGTVHANDTAFFDFLEKRIGAVIFAYTALESFANQSIREHLEKDENQPTEGEIYERERRPLQVKLDETLPKIFGIDSPKGTEPWHEYIALEKLRDRLIHLKSIDTENALEGKSNPDTIWPLIGSPDVAHPVAQALTMIRYFAKEWPMQRRWYAKLPDLTAS